MAKVLIVDDSGYQRGIVKKVVAEEGFETIEAANGRLGLESAKAENPDLILMDIVMPDMDGIEVLTAMKEEGMNIPVVVVSADIQETTQKQCMDLGAVGFVTKPLKGEELATLKNLLKVYLD